VLIKKERASESDMIAPDQIPPIYDGSDVRLNNEKYAWFPWMKERSPRTYGPELMKRDEAELHD
jgi:hypothetical protein